MRLWFSLLLLLSIAFSLHAQAHELRPAYLSITETTATQQENQTKNQYSILWKTPALGEKQLALKTIFPATCTNSNGIRTVEKSKFAIETWTLTCPQSLRGQSVTIGGLEKTLTDVLVRTAWADGKTFTARLTPDNTRLDFENAQTQGGVIKTYFLLGLKHILSGIDHLLFVLAVVLLITDRRKLFFAITAFTVGHSVTLALAALDIVRIDPSLVELLIAMSIVLMAYEAARHWRHKIRSKPGLTLTYPWLVTLLFGLLHGFGFAGALQSIGLPQGDIPLALLFFNIGVEAGQILFIACIAAAVYTAARLTFVMVLMGLPSLHEPVRNGTPMRMASYGIGIVAVFWTLQRAMPIILA